MQLWAEPKAKAKAQAEAQAEAEMKCEARTRSKMGGWKAGVAVCCWLEHLFPVAQTH